ncbi:MAG: four helix bundle protein [Bacteroidales bacterium]|nr:four helix bundle protein [Bacteroidales bacterium]MBN2756090.1 four helix bundle protein [Bacteroidales bacterium]
MKDNIAERFGRRRYKSEFIRFLIFSHASCDEIISQLNMISEIHFLENPLADLINKYEQLSKQINKFIQYLEINWKT